MKTISRYYNHVCTQKYRSLGFSRKKTTFARISGDVLQAFTLKCSQYVPVCTVDFGVFPLCLPQPIYLYAGGYELDKFIIDIHEKSSGWAFDAGSDQNMIDCVEAISEVIDMHLLPLFDKCIDCKSSLPELIKLEELFDRNRQKTLHLLGDSNCARPWQELSLFDYRKYFMALKAHDIPYAKQYLYHQINFCETKLKEFDKPNSTRQPGVVRDRFSAKLSVYLEQLGRLDSEDFCYFNDMLKSNENQMLKYLADEYPKIISKQ